MTTVSHDLAKMPYGQLKSLASQVDQALSAKRRETAQKIAKIAEDTDIKLEELKALAVVPATRTAIPVASNGNGTHARKPEPRVTKGKAKKAVTKPGQVAFRDPENPKQTWTGRGPRPRWMVERIAAGATPDSLRA